MNIETKGHGMSIALNDEEIERIHDLLEKPSRVRDCDEVVSLCTLVQKIQEGGVQTYGKLATMSLREAIR